MKRWVPKESDANIALMSETLGISEVLCRILVNRGIRTKNSAIKFLNPLLSYLHPAELMKDMSKAVGIVKEGIKQGKRFCIFGDYDVDGVSGTVILFKALRGLGADCTYYIPHREKEGYGLNIDAVEKIAEDNQVLITVDNGINSMFEIDRAKELGMEVIVIDHHQPDFKLPEACAIINPKQTDCEYPFKEKSAAALVYKFCKYLYEVFGEDFTIENEALIFAAIANFCDVVDLVDENRIIAKNGLRLLNAENFTNIGLDTLAKTRKLGYNKIDDYAIGFILGPCINASGRLSSAGLAVELFLTEDETRAIQLAETLVELNDKRKDLCARFVEDTIEKLDKELEDGKKQEDVLVIYLPELHESIAGIVAGRVKEHTGRPVIVFAKGSAAIPLENGGTGDVAKGSARSIEAYNIFEEMQKCKDLFIRFGGHKMAAGVTLPIADIDVLRQRLNYASTLMQENFIPVIHFDMQLELDDVTFELAQDITALAPFGKANKEPVFITCGIFTERAEVIGQSGQTLRLIFRSSTGRKITAVAFKSADKFFNFLKENHSEEVAQNFAKGRMRNMKVKMDIAYHIRINTYQGNSSLQLVVLDFRAS